MTLTKAYKLVKLAIENKEKKKKGLLDPAQSWNQNFDSMKEFAKGLAEVLDKDIKWLKAIKKEDRRIPFEYMVYLGDGPGDIPCFSAVKGNGGNCIGIVGKHSVHKGYQLARGKRTTVGPYSRNYKKGSDLRNVLDTIVKKIGYDIVDRKRRNLP